ncbi:MAG: hypothetical protein PUE67_05565 [Oscillospiraceae bacterium]|nr:hypothetical protein [Oscillospiraceae bacterium]
MLIKSKIKNIDYNEIADILFKQKFAKQNENAFMINLIKLIIGGMKLMPHSLRDVAVIKLFTIYSENIVGMINKQISDREIDVKIKDLTLKGGSMLMNIQIDVESINYQQIIIKFLPQIIGLIPKSENTKVFADTLDVVGDDIDKAVKALLNNLDDEKKEKLTKLYANHYSLEILSLLNKLIAKNDITAEIIDFSVS